MRKKSWKIRTSGEGGGFGNSDAPGQGEGGWFENLRFWRTSFVIVDGPKDTDFTLTLPHEDFM